MTSLCKMSMDIEAEREVTVVRGGPITVRKSALDLGREGVSGVKLALTSDSAHSVSVELHERVPGHVSLSDLQVHPQYGPEKWRKDTASHRMAFEDELSPGGSVETVYGVRFAPDQLGPFLGDPVLERVAVDGEDAPADQAANGSPMDEQGGGDTPDAGGSSGAGDRTPLGDPVGTDEEGQLARAEANETVDASTSSSAEERGTEEADGGSDGFRYGEDRAAIAGADVTDGPDGPDGVDREIRAQLDGLQTTVTRLASSVEALDRRLDESGDSSDVAEELRSRQDDLEESLEDVTDRLRTESERRAELADQLRDGAAERATLQDRLGTAEEHRDELSARLRAEEDDRAALAERVASLEDQLLELRDRYECRLESLTDRVDELESTFSPEESRAIREVIAAERRWKRQRESLERPARMTPNGSRR